MRALRSDLVPLALCLLAALTLHSRSVAAQDKMSAEDEAIYRSMMQNIMDPAAMEESRRKAAASRRWTARSMSSPTATSVSPPA